MSKLDVNAIEKRADLLFNFVEAMLWDGEKYAAEFSYVFIPSHKYYSIITAPGVAKEFLLTLRANYPDHKATILVDNNKQVMVRLLK